jgi:hypothetical protein
VIPRPALFLLLGLAACAPEPESVPANGFAPELVAVELNCEQVRPGDSLLCTLRFANRGSERAARDYRVFLHFESPGERCEVIGFQKDHDPDPPTSWWPPGEEIDLGARVIRVPENLREGVYAIHAGLFWPEDEERLVEATPTTITVVRDAPHLEKWSPRPLSSTEIHARREALTERLSSRRSLRGKSWVFSFGTKHAAFELEDSTTGVRWSSDPLQNRAARVHLRSGELLETVPLDHFDSVSAEGDRLVTHTSLELRGVALGMTLNLIAEPIEDGVGLSLSWRIAGKTDWTVDSVILLDRAFWTSDTDRGAVVIPQWLGELVSARGSLPDERHYRSNDISMQMAGVLKQDSALLLSWTDPHAVLTSHAAIHDHERVAGRATRCVSLELSRDHPTVEIFPLGSGSYVDIARAYRRIAKRRGWRETWAQKREAEERTALLEGAPVFRLECLLRELPGTAKVRHSFEEVADCAVHWREDLQIDKATLLLGGWNRRGYDNGHPDILPANSECGGDEKLAACSAKVRSLGYLFGLHDNYQDIYSDSPSWNPELVGRDEEGEMRKGGVWAGGQSWMVCSSLQLDFARRNLPRVAELFHPDIYFLDTTLTTRLLTCTHPDHPMTPEEDREYRLGLFRYTRDLFGLVGLEGAR